MAEFLHQLVHNFQRGERFVDDFVFKPGHSGEVRWEASLNRLLGGPRHKAINWKRLERCYSRRFHFLLKHHTYNIYVVERNGPGVLTVMHGRSTIWVHNGRVELGSSDPLPDSPDESPRESCSLL